MEFLVAAVFLPQLPQQVCTGKDGTRKSTSYTTTMVLAGGVRTGVNEGKSKYESTRRHSPS